MQKDECNDVFEKVNSMDEFSLFVAAGEDVIDITSRFCNNCFSWIDESDVENHGCLQYVITIFLFFYFGDMQLFSCSCIHSE